MNETAPIPAPESPGKEKPKPERATGGAVASALIVTLIVAGIVGLSIWYLARPQPLIVQGEADATRVDIAARIDGRVGQRPVDRGENVAKGQLLFEIDNPELVAKWRQAQAGVDVAKAQLANILAGTRAETIAQRKAEDEAAEANFTLAQRTYDRIKELAGSGNAPLQRLDEVTNSLEVAKRQQDQAKLAYEEAVNGATKEERAIAQTNVLKAQASVDTIKAQVDELVVKSPIAGQVYQIGAELGEYVSPGVPLLSLVDLSDVWLRFNLREDLVRGLKVGDRFTVARPALGDQEITAEIKLIADARRIRRLAGDAGDRRLRSENLRGARLSGHAPSVPKAGHERLRRVAVGRAAMKAPARPGLLTVATRELRWMRRDQVALLLSILVPRSPSPC